MRTLLRLLILLLIPLPLWANTSVISGTFKDGSGNPLNGTLYLQLPVPAVDTTTNTSVSLTPIAYRIVNGILQGGPAVFDVAQLQPQNLYYQATVYDNAGTKVFTANYAITGASYNLSAAIPTNVTTFNISYVSPAVTNAPNVFCCTQTFQGQIVSTIAIGTPPFSVVSTTLVPNLNVAAIDNVTVTGTPSTGQVPTATSSTAATWQTPAQSLLSAYTNNGTGTVTNLLAKPTGNPATVTVSGLADTGGAIGICFSGCGNSGTAQITTIGQASCTFDGATTAEDYVIISNSVQANCHDAGATYPKGVQVLGRVLSTNGGNGTYNMTLFGAELIGPPTYVVKSISGAGCTTQGTSFSNCDVTLTWPGGGFADANYNPTCSLKDTNMQASGGDGSSGDVPSLPIRSFNATQIVATVQTLAARAITNTNVTVYCIGVHP